MPAVFIEVGASVNSNLGNIFRPAEDASARARRKLEADANAIARNAIRAQQRADAQLEAMKRKAAQQSVTIAARAAQQEVRESEKASAAIARARQKQVVAEQRAFDQRMRANARARASEERDILRTADRAIRQEQRMAERVGRGRRQFVVDAGRETARTLGTVANVAGRFGGQVARGMGVNLDLQSNMSAGSNLETRVTDLVNAGYMPGKAGKAGVLQDRGAVTGDIKSVADKYGFSRASTVEGLQAFVGKSGNLEMGRSSLDDMARLAKATGTELNDMLSAAGELAPQLENSVDPAGDLLQVMRDMAGQGKAGAIEIKDLASLFASITASGAQFEGDVANNMKSLGVMAQLARQYGGARSAAEAMTGISGFTTTLKKNARREAFEGEGISLEGAGGLMRDPIQIMKDAIFKTGGDVGRINKLFMDVRGAKPVEGLANIYRQAGGGAAGEKAVNDKLAELGAATLTAAEESRALGLAMDTTATKAQKFNNRLEDIAGRFQTNLLPVMERVAPQFESLIMSIAKAVEWAAENPGMAITAAIVGSIAKAAIGTAISAAITSWIAGAAGAAGVGAGGAAVAGGAAGAAGKGLLAGAGGVVAVAGASVATGAYLRSLYNDVKDADDVEREWALQKTGGVRDGNAVKTRRNKHGMMETYEADEAQKAWGGLRGAFAGQVQSMAGKAEGSPGADALAAAATKLSGSNDALAAKLGGVLNVNIVGGMPGAPPGGAGGGPVPEPRGP